MNNYWRGVILTILAAVSWGVISPVAKILAGSGISLMSVMVFRAFFVVAALGPYLLFTRGRKIFSVAKPDLGFYCLSGLLSVVCSGGGFLMSLEYLSVAEALILHYTFPLVTLLGSLYITHEKPTKLQVLAGFLIIAGVYSGMVSGEKSFGGVSVPGLLWGLLAIVGISGQALVARRVSKKQQTDQCMLLFYAHFSGGVLLFLGKTAMMGWQDLVNFTPHLFYLMLFQSMCGSLLAYAFFYSALKYIPAATVSLICTLEIVVAVGLAALTLGAIPSVNEIFGCMIIIIAIFCAAVRPRNIN
jgi:drug/metabolite transporter (DMT)-like permease